MNPVCEKTSSSGNECGKPLVPGYKASRLIGKGSVGTVYEAVNPSGETIAIKIMCATPFLDPGILEDIVEGALITRKIPAQANIVRVRTAGKTDDCYYIETELLKGGTLEKIINDREFPLGKKLQIAVSLANTLSICHSTGIIHGDLKPSNILMTEDWTPCLNDFYLALYSIRSKGQFKALAQGTPRYMSPEQAEGKFITTASDIYSFGVLLYELLTNRIPYEMKISNINDMLLAIKTSEILSPRSINAEITHELNAVLLKLLEREIGKRYESMSLVESDIKACIENRAISIPCQKSARRRVLDFFRIK